MRMVGPGYEACDEWGGQSRWGGWDDNHYEGEDELADGKDGQNQWDDGFGHDEDREDEVDEENGEDEEDKLYDFAKEYFFSFH